jgi:ribose 5-phosphate isomerase B
MKVAVGSDHAGLPAKRKVVETLRELGCEVIDMGTNSEESTDYPDYAVKVSEAVAGQGVDFGVLCCGTGLGMSITANKIRGVRAALAHDAYTAEMGRSHNDANVLCMGARVLDGETIDRLVRIFLSTPFDGGRHARRVQKIHDAESPCCTPEASE